MKIIEKDGEFMMKDFPVTNWAMGVFLILGFLIFVIPLAAKGFQARSSLLVLALIVFGSYWVYKKLSSPIIITRIKPLERTIEITDIKFGLIRKTQTFNFSQVKCFEMVRRKPERAYLYFNVMTLLDGSQIDLESNYHATSRISGIPNKLNEILGKDRSLPKIS